MRKHVMVRIGGGWDTFDHYITKHDPCRTKISGTFLLYKCKPSSPSKTPRHSQTDKHGLREIQPRSSRYVFY